MDVRKVYPATPWARQAWAALSEEQRTAIEVAVPGDHYLVMGAGRNRGDWSATLMHGTPASRPTDERAVEVVTVRNYRSIALACWGALYLATGQVVPHG